MMFLITFVETHRNLEMEPILNAHNKSEYEPAHSCEHLLNATMVKMFGCPRSKNAHIERKKSKCDYLLETEPDAAQVAEIESRVNEAIAREMDVTVEFMSREEAALIVDLSKLPEDASQTLRIVRIGDYDACACIGAHVNNTREIGEFRIISHSYADGVWRLRWKVVK
jgi:alanyl-tRNA synthetase